MKKLDRLIDLSYRTMITKGAVFVVNAASDFCLYVFFGNVLGVFLPAAQLLSYGISSLVRYIFYGVLKYNPGSGGHIARFLRFICIDSAALVLSPLMLSLLLTVTGDTGAKLLVLAMTGLWQYLLRKYCVFI